MIQQRN